jgi:hypothetical protein
VQFCDIHSFMLLMMMIFARLLAKASFLFSSTTTITTTTTTITVVVCTISVVPLLNSSFLNTNRSIEDEVTIYILGNHAIQRILIKFVNINLNKTAMLADKEKELNTADAWLEKNSLNRYGDEEDVMYMEESPLFNESTAFRKIALNTLFKSFQTSHGKDQIRQVVRITNNP